MRSLSWNILAAALLSVTGTQASATPSVASVICQNFSSTATPYDDCVGLTTGNTNLASANAAFGDDANYIGEYKDNNTGAGSDNNVFDLVNNGNDTVTLKFLQNVGDGNSTALIALKFGGQGVNQLGYFRFNNADFDIGETLTFSWNPSFLGDGISHASLYSTTLVPGELVPNGNVPEPATCALMLAGLAAVGVASRRRRPD